jgi:hypothetical protein
VSKLASKLTDTEFELLEKEIISTVRDYLRDMELDQYYIDKLIATSSQDGYLPSDADLEKYPLDRMPPSLEEVVLSKCRVLSSSEEGYLTEKLGRVPKSSEIIDKLLSGAGCERKQLDTLRMAAWNREKERMISYRCDHFMVDPASIRTCRDYADKNITEDAVRRGSEARPGDVPPENFSVDDSLLTSP